MDTSCLKINQHISTYIYSFIVLGSNPICPSLFPHLYQTNPLYLTSCPLTTILRYHFYWFLVSTFNSQDETTISQRISNKKKTPSKKKKKKNLSISSPTPLPVYSSTSSQWIHLSTHFIKLPDKTTNLWTKKWVSNTKSLELNTPQTRILMKKFSDIYSETHV